jgi:hypothetical protein
MALNTSVKDNAVARREKVAKLRLRGLSQAAIADALNVSVGTINRDLKILLAQWREAAQVSIADHLAQQVAELREVRRVAWAEKDLRTVLRAVETEAKLVGTMRPPTIQINVPLVLIEQAVHAIEEIGADPAAVFQELIKEAAAEKALRQAQPSPPPTNARGAAA